MKLTRCNVRPGHRLEIVAPFGSYVGWMRAASAARELGRELGCEVIVRAASTEGWRGRWVDGLTR